MRNKTVLSYALAILFMVPVFANANTWSCITGDLLREVSVEYEGAAAIPCNVVYNKPTEGETSEVLWFAENVEGFCEQQAEYFVSRLESWGWECVAKVQPASE